MKRTLTFMISPSLKAKFDEALLNRSAAVTQSIVNANDNPEKLVDAFRFRLSQPEDANTERIGASVDPRIDDMLERLSSMTKLPIEQVLRLAMEAYINKL